MVHPVLFKDKCSCGGNLYKVNKFGSKAELGDEVVGLRCDSCRDVYFVSWDIATGEPKPLFSKKESIDSFLSKYKEYGDK